MTALTTPAPAKLNWTLEVLGRRPDGYHEVRTILQTLDLADEVRVRPGRRLELLLTGRCEALAGLPEGDNLAYRAAALLQAVAGHPGGARIEIEKRIPVGAGMGGGSSDAAAVLRALVALWGLRLSRSEMAQIAGELGSDVPFFLLGGTALAQGRGETVTPLPDSPPTKLLLVVPPGEAEPAKTARMYGRLRDEHFGNGSATAALAARLESRLPPRPEDLANVFDAVAAGALADVRRALPAAGALHLTGAGRGLYHLPPQGERAEATPRLQGAGYQVLEVSTLPAAAAIAVSGGPAAGADRPAASGEA